MQCVQTRVLQKDCYTTLGYGVTQSLNALSSQALRNRLFKDVSMNNAIALTEHLVKVSKFNEGFNVWNLKPYHLATGSEDLITKGVLLKWYDDDAGNVVPLYNISLKDEKDILTVRYILKAKGKAVDKILEIPRENLSSFVETLELVRDEYSSLQVYIKQD